jgi:hypothetical protein
VSLIKSNQVRPKIKMPMSIATARSRVVDYCEQEKIKREVFAEQAGLTKSTLQRFMGAGRETTGKGSLAYSAIASFFGKVDRLAKKEQKERYEKQELEHAKKIVAAHTANRKRQIELSAVAVINSLASTSKSTGGEVEGTGATSSNPTLY